MNQNFKRFFSIAALICSTSAAIADDGSCSTCPTSCAKAQNLYQPHAFSSSFSREIMLEQAAWTPMSDEEGWHGCFGVGFNYMRTFNNCDTTGCCSVLGSLPFWAADGSNTMTIGSNDSSNDLDGYQMGLGPIAANFGTVSLNPSIYQTGADFLIYVGSHKTERGFFLKAKGPVGVININPRLRYSVNDDDEVQTYPIGSLNGGTVAPTAGVAAPYENIRAAFQGGTAAGFLQPMNKGLITCDRTSSAKFGDLEFAIGYNVYADEKKHFGLAVRFSAPTGNKPEGVYVLEPIFGRAGHWGAGGEIIGHWRFYESDNEDKYAQIFLDGAVLHLFKAQHIRSFDLANNGPGSKYMLIAQYSPGGVVGAPAAFQNNIINAVNITTVSVNSTFAAEGDFAIGFDFHWKRWSLEIGYEGWGRTCEKLCLNCNCPGATNYSQYAVLGRQTPFATDGTTVLNNCEPAAQIGNSQDQYNLTTNRPTGIADATLSVNHIPSDPNIALDIEGQRARSVYTNKPYAEIRHTWTDSDYVPFLSITGGAEIPSGCHKNEAARFWNVGINGGIAF